MICKVCKQKIENEAFAVYSEQLNGHVHQGSCQEYLNEQPIKEDNQQLVETELLL